MASIQACGSAEAYQAKYNVTITQMCQMAQNVMTKHCHDRGAKTAGCIKNTADGKHIKFLNKHDWSGNNKEVYPRTITKNHFGTFVHGSSHCGGNADEAAVVYTDESGSAWLLAWSVKEQSAGCNNINKVYVETGPICNYMNIDWCDIKNKLDASCDTSYYVDETSGNEAFAKVTDGSNAKLVASYTSYC